MRKILMLVVFIAGFFQGLYVFAAEGSTDGGQKYDYLKSALKLLSPDTEPDMIGPAPVPGLVEVLYGPKVFYVSEDGRFIIDGMIIDTSSMSNITEVRSAQARKAALGKLDEEGMIIYSPVKTKHTITVFTDVDCGYCRKLHNQMAAYNNLGIKVRYLLYPRTRPGSPSYNKAISVWCAKDRARALTDAKTGVDIESIQCSNPISNNIQFGRWMGVTGTPSILREDGALIPGYLPPDQLLRKLEELEG